MVAEKTAKNYFAAPGSISLRESLANSHHNIHYILARSSTVHLR